MNVMGHCESYHKSKLKYHLKVMPLHGHIDFLMSKTETTTLSATLNVIWHYESDHIKSKLKYCLKIMCPPWTYRLPNHQKPRLQHSTLNVIWHCKSYHIKSKKVTSELLFFKWHRKHKVTEHHMMTDCHFSLNYSRVMWTVQPRQPVCLWDICTLHMLILQCHHCLETRRQMQLRGLSAFTQMGPDHFELPENSVPRLRKAQYRNWHYGSERLRDLHMHHQKPRTGHISDWKTNKPQNRSRTFYYHFFVFCFCMLKM